MHPAIAADKFPKQGPHLNRRAQVCFNFDTSTLIGAEVVRDDYVDPWLTILRLDDGRHVLATECMWSPGVTA